MTSFTTMVLVDSEDDDDNYYVLKAVKTTTRAYATVSTTGPEHDAIDGARDRVSGAE
jgi:hypothetical protein